MKKVDELLAIIENIAPHLKASEKIFICDLVINERHEAYKEGGIFALKSLKELEDETDIN